MENRYLLIFMLLITTTLRSNAQSIPCTKYKFAATLNKPNGYRNCIDLPVLSSALHYSYNPSMETLNIAYRHPGMGPGASSKWVAWALNPTAKGMVGAQSLVAYRSPKDGSVVAYTSPITSYATTLTKGDLSFNVTGLKAEIVNDEIVMVATIKVPNNGTVLNQVWQEGPLSADGTAQQHPLSGPNVRSMASLNLLSGVLAPTAGAAGLGSSWKYAHGVMNVVSWGILMPLGIIIARHMKAIIPSADPTWFYLHVGCQLTAYIVGVAGWATGLKISNGSHEFFHLSHRWIGIILFCMATLQVSALLIRPHIEHQYRNYWNKYHHTIGYLILSLSTINILQGLKLLDPALGWKIAYLGVLLVYVVVDVVLEYIVNKRRKSDVADK
ncbi:cytochrome b561 and DOMON domain-containing protein At4g17280-like [Chenopodium quinoa]|uniref:cytochrome b561 and DOMON domain-containing protein At4g17280-like n=1 Tax=Chenopodium quinoa TaxID=63459 RepID=UPI000B7701DB|nr:cytochrome b561 and DOMON domain-containing protein At4g17280-like [Chenopodium quinoa]